MAPRDKVIRVARLVEAREDNTFRSQDMALAVAHFLREVADSWGTTTPSNQFHAEAIADAVLLDVGVG
jgi:hypothetical protein